MIPVSGVKGQTFGVLGLGRSGLSAAKALQAGGAHVLAWDDGEAGRIAAENAGLTLEDLRKDKAIAQLDCLVTSPGIPHLYPKPHPAIEAALRAGVPVDNDIGLFFRSLANSDWLTMERPPQVVAITGSNGKSTTSALLHHILEDSGRPSYLAGNIGRGVFDLDPPEEGAVIVLELSSYQTELARALTPDVAVFTNLSPDHLDRHSGMGGYYAAKRRLFSEGGPDRAIIGVDQIEGLFIAGQLQELAGDDRVIRVSSGQKLQGAGWSVFARKGFLSEMRKGRQIASVDLRQMPSLPGAHNHQNACCAYAAARAFGLGPKQIETAMQSFAGLPHRSQQIARLEKDGGTVLFVNDSKATNVDAATQALSAFPKIRWIVGGMMKEGDLSPLAQHYKHVAKAYVIGREAQATALALGDVATQVCGDMQSAVNAAASDAEAGEVVLLAPAAASFDQFDNFEARGAAFCQAVQMWLVQQSV